MSRLEARCPRVRHAALALGRAALGRAALALGLVALACGCGAAASGLSLSAADNDAGRIARVLARPRPEPPARSLGFFVVRAAPPELRALDLSTGARRWSVPAEVRSRLVVGATLLASREGDALVARAIADGQVLWRRPFGAGARLIGLAADGDRVIVCTETAGARAVAMIEGGAERWRLAAPGPIGAPAADGGLVLLPLQSQWLALLDGATGQVLARVRRNDLAVVGARVLKEGVTYGSRAVLRLEDGPAAAPVPARLPAGVEATWFLDGYNPAGAAYSALDRARLLWRPAPGGGFAGPVVALAFRALFAYDPESGALRWARAIPRADVVSAEHAGAALLIVTADGELDVLDPASGVLLAEASVGDPVAGAAFAAEGFRPRDPPAPAAAGRTEEALAAIATSRETHFLAARAQAVRELGRLGTLRAVTALVGLLVAPTTPEGLAALAAAALRDRRDPAVVAPLLDALAVHADRVTGRRPRAVALLARILGAARAREAVGPLLDHLEDPATPDAVLEEVAGALAAIGDPAAGPRLGSFLLLHRCDPAQAAAATATLDALLAVGGAAGREIVAFVAADPLTAPELARHARAKLGRPVTPRRMKIIVCRGPECGEHLGSQAIHAAFHEALRLRNLLGQVDLGWQSCFGQCRRGPNVLVRPVAPGEGRLLVALPPTGGPGSAFYSGVRPADALGIIDEHVVGGRPVRSLIRRLGDLP